MATEGVLRAEFSYRPRTADALDALYVAYPRQRDKISGLLGVSIIGALLGVVAAIAGAAVPVWVTCLMVAALALVALGWWALAQCRGSVFSAGPAMVHVDDRGLLVRPAGAHGALVPWSSLRGWGETDRVIVLFPGERSGPLHVIPAAAVRSSESAAAFRELLQWHLGKPKP